MLAPMRAEALNDTRDCAQTVARDLVGGQQQAIEARQYLRFKRFEHPRKTAVHDKT